MKERDIFTPPVQNGKIKAPCDSMEDYANNSEILLPLRTQGSGAGVFYI
jgi:hypothetical protein